MTRSRVSDIRLFSTDLDGTLLGSEEGCLRFRQTWSALDPLSRPILVYNTGRTVAETRMLVEHGELPAPDYIIGGLGTELSDGRFGSDPSFARRFGAGWNPVAIDEVLARLPGIERREPRRQHPSATAWFWPGATPDQLAALRAELAASGLLVRVSYADDGYIDVVPAHADKGKALQWLCDRLGVALKTVLVAGDTAHDAAMFHLPWVRRIFVENAAPELLATTPGLPAFRATQPMAEGVIEGLFHFGVATPPGRLSAAST